MVLVNQESGAVKAEMARSALGITRHWARDRLKRSRPAEPGEVPPSVDALTPEWLTAALCSGVPGATVTDFELSEGSDGTSARRPLEVTYNEEGVAAELPTALYTKSTPTLMTRLMYGLNNLAEQEGNFYMRIRPELEIEAPRGYCAVHDPRSAASMLIMDDLVATRGAEFGDMLTGSFDRAQAEGQIELLAAYHGPFWESPRLDTEFTWLLSETEWQQRFTEGLGYKRIVHNGLKRGRDVMPDSIVSREAQIWQALVDSIELSESEARTLIHRDTHSRNWYTTADGRMGIYDWQVNGKGCWAIDVAYAIGVGLRIEDRRAWERELLELYLQRVADAGGDPPAFERAWTAYRQQLMHGFAYWLATLGLMKLQPETQPPDACRAAISRLAQAAEDLETLDAVGIR